MDTSREIYQQGQVSALWFVVALLATGVAFGTATLWLLEKAVLSPLTRLSAAVSDVGTRGDLSTRVPVTDRDELSRLAGDINRMLEALEHAQRELRESEERYRVLFNSGSDLVFVTEVVNGGRLGNIIEVNDEACQRLGYTREELLNSLPLELVAPEHREDIPALAQRFPTEKRTLFETVGVTKNGARFLFEISAHLFNLSDRPAVLSVARDITERKQVEAELSQHLQEQETIFAIGQLVSSSLQIDEVLQIVAEQMVRLVNAASCAISDWDPETETLTVQAEYTRPAYVDPDDPVNDIGQSYSVSDYPATAAALHQGKPFVVYVDDPEADAAEHHLLQLYQWDAVAGVPLIVQDRIIGLAEVYLAENERSFDSHDLRLLQALANQVAVAIDNARLFSAVQASEAAMRDLSLRLINVQEQERRYIAQELHDELGQLLTAAKISIDLVRRRLAQQAERLGAEAAASLQSRLEDASTLTDKVLTNVRAITVELRPTLLDDMGIVPTLRWHLNRFETRTCIQVAFDAQEPSRRLQPEIETTIYRGVQEALTNVVRYAQAQRVQVRLAILNGTVTTVVEDDGQGFDVHAWSERPGEQQTLGLTGIQERAMLLDGRATITSQPGRGTRVEIVLPARFRLEEQE
jgi:PAS domain S-box-containing protein